MKHLLPILLLLVCFNYSQAQCPQSINVTNSHCTAFRDTVDARVLTTRLCGDSLTIIFNAAGTPLNGDTNIYFHSGPEFSPFTGWQLPYTVGHFTLNDGVGRMTFLGNNRWSITIQPRTYYHYPVDSCLNGIFCLFRNYNGTTVARDNGNDIYLYTAPTVPTSTYASIQGVRSSNHAITYTWSDGNTDSIRIFTTRGNYTVTATGVGGCAATGTVNIRTASAPVNLGADIHRCDTLPVIINAGAGYTGYKWLDGAFTSNATYAARKPGCYWIQVFDSANCYSLDTIQVTNTEVRNLAITDSILSCPGHNVSVDASVNIIPNGDSLVIIYDATQGQTGLVGDTNVYFHSGPEFHAFQGWQLNYTVGHFNSNDGVGRMTSLGNNKWRIAIDPYCYYSINPDTSLNGIFMVFRNFDGTKTGKDATGQDIFVLLGNPPTAAFTGVTPSHKAGTVNYAWSNGTNTAINTISTAGTYYVTATDNHGCNKRDSVKVFFNGNYTVSLGADTTVCRGASATFRAPRGYASYTWSNGSHADSTTVAIAGTYTVTAVDSAGCQFTGTRKLLNSTAQVNLGPDITRCTSTTTVLSVGNGFTSIKWLDGITGTAHSYNAVKPGCYWVRATDSIGCASYDTVSIKNSDVANLSITDSAFTCPGHNAIVDASVNITEKGDSIVIIYNATQGVSTLAGDTNVYFHSGPEFHPFQGWQLPYTVGSFTQNDGIGRMTSLGNNKWRIAIDPYCYYNINPDTSLNSIFMVFRNYNGTKTGKDAAGNDIVVVLGTTPTTTFAGVTPSRKSGTVNYSWSNSVTGAVDSFGTAGLYSVTVTDNHGCSKSDTVRLIVNNNLVLNLGHDTTICPGQSIIFKAPAGYSGFTWSTGGHADSIVANTAGTYTLSAQDSSGCLHTGSITLSISHTQVSLGNDTVLCTPTNLTLNASTGFAAYKWLDGTVNASHTYTARKAGCYWIKAIDSFGCTSYDTVSVHYSNVASLNLTDSLQGCPGSAISMDASTTIEQKGDSLVIVYDATKGQTGLVGATKVYFHSGPEFRAFQGWNQAYTVGHFTQDDGIGKMDSLGANKWRIAIDPYCYYNINPDTSLNGIFMVFRNFNGTATGKDATGNDIFLSLSGTVPTSSFNGITAFRKTPSGITYTWSTGATSPTLVVTTTGNYGVTATDGHGCSKSDTVVVNLTNNLNVQIAADTFLCQGDTSVLTLNAGFPSYHWSTGDTTATIKTTHAGNYSVMVSSGNCSASDTINIVLDTKRVSIYSVDITRCNPNRVDTLIASAGFTSYKWFGTGQSSISHVAVKPGCYWVDATDSVGCVSHDTVAIHNSAVLGLNISDTATACPGDTVKADAAVSINAAGDSVIIIYDATQGQTQLQGATKVYFHSGPEFHQFQGWVGAYTVGHYGQDDGVGQMTSLGNNKWRIAIDPYCYYSINPDTTLNGIFMIFRNEDGTKTGKDATGSNIYVGLNTVVPSSGFSGVTATRMAAGPLTYSWSNGSTAAQGVFAAVGNYTVTVSDNNGCSKSDTIHVVGGAATTVNLGPDTVVCTGHNVVLSAGAGFSAYHWNTNATTATITVSTVGTYAVTVTNSAGCTGRDTVVVTSCTVNCAAPTSKFHVQNITPFNQVTLTDSSVHHSPATYQWHFGDGTTATDTGSTAHTYAAPGHYIVCLTVRDSCGADSSCKDVGVNVGIDNVEFLNSVNLYPNPASNLVHIEVNASLAATMVYNLRNILGEVVAANKMELVQGTSMLDINVNNLAQGIYTIELTNGKERVFRKLVITK